VGCGPKFGSRDLPLWEVAQSDQNFVWPKYFILGKQQYFFLVYRLPKHKTASYAKNLEWEWPPVYASDSGSRNNLNLHFKFAIPIRQNQGNHLLFYVLSFIKFCSRKLLLSLVVLKLIFKSCFNHPV